jgi:TPR repeat protein
MLRDEVARAPKKGPPSKGSAWLAGCGLALLLGGIATAGLVTITLLAMHSMGACLDGDDVACKRACFGISSDEESCVKHAEHAQAKGDLEEAKKAYKKACTEGDESACALAK